MGVRIIVTLVREVGGCRWCWESSAEDLRYSRQSIKRDMKGIDISGNVNMRSRCILFDHYLSLNARTLLRMVQLSKKRKSYVKVS